jgi:hypothetical protein
MNDSSSNQPETSVTGQRPPTGGPTRQQTARWDPGASVTDEGARDPLASRCPPARARRDVRKRRRACQILPPARRWVGAPRGRRVGVWFPPPRSAGGRQCARAPWPRPLPDGSLTSAAALLRLFSASGGDVPCHVVIEVTLLLQ